MANVYKDLNIQNFKDEIRGISTKYVVRLHDHANILAIALLNNSETTSNFNIGDLKEIMC